jgi:signal transduction histidine kinase
MVQKVMRKHLKRSYAEWGFVGLLAGFCAILSVLQYYWTDEISRAETEHLHAAISEQAHLFCLAFDSTLTRSCAALVPRDEDLSYTNLETVHNQLFQKWKSGNPRPIFSHITVMVSTPGGAWLFNQDLGTGKLVPSTIPPTLNRFNQNFPRPPGNGQPPFQNYQGLLFPAFVGQPGNFRVPPGGGAPWSGGRPFETELMVFELDTNYLRNTWLPALIQTYLNPPGQSFNDIIVKTVMSPSAVIYSSVPNAVNNPESPITVPFNREGRDPPPGRGPGGDYSWILEVRPHPGALEAIVASAHRRNLAVAILLNALIFAAGLALVHHTRRSRQLAEAQMNFVATVSHELRTPLTVIRGAGHNLLRGVAHEPGQIEQYSKLIIQHAEQLTEMVEQIIGLAGVMKYAGVLSHEPVAIAEMLREAVAATAQETKIANCDVQLDLPASLPVVNGDAAALRRVFHNLIANAAKHGGQGGWVGITAAQVTDEKPPMIEIRVADRGPGIQKSELSEIFKPFFRGAAARAMQVRGSGLGLSLVREIVEAHHGTVSVESNRGNGAVFVVRLPVATG